jgi:hypothetical protein
MVEEQTWPPGSAWVGLIASLSTQTLDALADYGTRNIAADPA